MRYVFIFLVACGSSTPPDHADDPPDAAIADPMPDAVVSATCEGRVAQPVDATWQIMHGGVTRSARVHVPASYDPSRRTPVVINLHGLTQSATQQAGLSHAIAKSDAEGFIAVHPDGTGSPRSWNAGTCCDPAASANVDDVGFIAKLLGELEAKLCVAPERVYAMGLSNGGHMAYRLACDLADRIAAVGPVAGLLHRNPCQASRPVPVFHVHGNSDAIVSYSYVAQGITFWKNRNSCTMQTTTYQNGAATCVTQGGCTAGADVTLCTINGGGHQWPGGDALPFMGVKSDDLIATDALWDFFVAHPRPTATQ